MFPWHGASRPGEGENWTDQRSTAGTGLEPSDSICRFLHSREQGDGESQRQVGPPPTSWQCNQHLPTAKATFLSPRHHGSDSSQPLSLSSPHILLLVFIVWPSKRGVLQFQYTSTPFGSKIFPLLPVLFYDCCCPQSPVYNSILNQWQQEGSVGEGGLQRDVNKRQFREGFLCSETTELWNVKNVFILFI